MLPLRWARMLQPSTTLAARPSQTYMQSPSSICLVEAGDIAKVDGQSSAMESLGFEVMGEFGIAGRRYFRKDNSEGIRTHQIHAFEAGSAEAERHLAFRDYMIAHPEDAQRYSELKKKLADEHPQSMNGYMDGKDAFIKEIDQKAARWRTSLF